MLEPIVTRKSVPPRQRASGPIVATDAIMTVNETAALLRVERKLVYDLVSRGDLPGARRVGRLIRISRDAVMSWLDNRKLTSAER